MLLGLLVCAVLFVLYFSYETYPHEFSATASAIQAVWSGNCRLACRRPTSNYGTLSVYSEAPNEPNIHCVCANCPCQLVENVLRSVTPVSQLYNKFTDFIFSHLVFIFDTGFRFVEALYAFSQCRTGCVAPVRRSAFMSEENNTKEIGATQTTLPLQDTTQTVLDHNTNRGTRRTDRNKDELRTNSISSNVEDIVQKTTDVVHHPSNNQGTTKDDEKINSFQDYETHIREISKESLNVQKTTDQVQNFINNEGTAREGEKINRVRDYEPQITREPLNDQKPSGVDHNHSNNEGPTRESEKINRVRDYEPQITREPLNDQKRSDVIHNYSNNEGTAREGEKINRIRDYEPQIRRDSLNLHKSSSVVRSYSKNIGKAKDGKKKKISPDYEIKNKAISKDDVVRNRSNKGMARDREKIKRAQDYETKFSAISEESIRGGPSTSTQLVTPLRNSPNESLNISSSHTLTAEKLGQFCNKCIEQGTPCTPDCKKRKSSTK